MIMTCPLDLLQVPGFQLDISEHVELQRVLSVCYSHTRNFKKAQALMEESFETSKTSSAPSERCYATETAVDLAMSYM